jgi:predicted dehydrogenase
MNQFRVPRRGFLQTAAAVSAANALPAWFLEECQAQESTRASSSPSDKPAVALIGCGGRGRGIAQAASAFGRIVALCDVDDAQAAAAKKTWPSADVVKDFRSIIERKDIDLVLCGTVDHWHTLISAAAMQAGKDVYCEKPLTLTIDEGKRLVRVANETGRILQTGSQQRSDPRFRLACELVRNGRIGKGQRRLWTM